MPLRACAACGTNLPAGATARAKFCSATCRQRGHRGTEAPLSIVRHEATEDASDTPAKDGSRLSALEAAVARLDRLLDESDPRSAAALNKEYRETLRELESVRAETMTGAVGDRSGARRRPFNAAAI